MEPEDRSAALDVGRNPGDSRVRLGLDHVAHPSFDVAATQRFYVDVLGGRLTSALSGDSPEWNARFLLAAYDVCGAEVDFFTFEGIRRPVPDGLPHDIRHVGIGVASQPDLDLLRARLDRYGTSYWVERHDESDALHLYAPDPNGLVLEFSVATAAEPAQADALAVLQPWMEKSSGG